MLVIIVVHILDAILSAVVGHKGFIRGSVEWAHYSQVATAPVSYASHSQPAPIKTLCCTTPWRLFSMWASSALMVAGSGPWVKCSVRGESEPWLSIAKTPLFFEKTFGHLFKSPKLRVWRDDPFVIWPFWRDEEGPNWSLCHFSC